MPTHLGKARRHRRRSKLWEEYWFVGSFVYSCFVCTVCLLGAVGTYTCNGLFKSVATFGYKCRLQSYRLGAETSPVGPSAQSYLSKVWTISAKPCWYQYVQHLPKCSNPWSFIVRPKNIPTHTHKCTYKITFPLYSLHSSAVWHTSSKPTNSPGPPTPSHHHGRWSRQQGL